MTSDRTQMRGEPACSPAVCAREGRHGDAKDSPTVLCEHCWTIRWNGVDLCAKKVSTSKILVPVGGRFVPSKHHICTRPVGHGGACESYKLEKSYQPR